MAKPQRINGFAKFSDCGMYRYELGGDIVCPSHRKSAQIEAFSLTDVSPRASSLLWTLLVIMLNPSTANASTNDPTITRCIGYAYAWGYRRMLVGNAYAYRATKPADMFTAQKRGIDIVGPANDNHLREMMGASDGVLVAWGGNCERARALEIQALSRAVGKTLHCLRINNDGSPVHPLYQPKDLTMQPWSLVA